MSIYSNDNISKIAKLTTRELPHLAKNAKITVRENNGVYSKLIHLQIFEVPESCKSSSMNSPNLIVVEEKSTDIWKVSERSCWYLADLIKPQISEMKRKKYS